MNLTIGIILFLFGFLLGGLIIWLIRQKEIDSVQSNQEHLKAEFGNLSKQALDQNLDTFLKLAENKFSELVKYRIDRTKKNGLKNVRILH